MAPRSAAGILRGECLAQAPSPDVDDVGELALLVDEEERPPAVAEPVQAS